MVVDRALDKGAEVEVTVQAPPSLSLALIGRVMRCTPLDQGQPRWTAGIEFEQVPEDAKAGLAKMMKDLLGL